MQQNNSKHHVLVINCGSSSVKFSLINPSNGAIVLTALAERLNSNNALFSITRINTNASENNEKITISLEAPYDHKAAINCLVAYLNEQQLIASINVVGHRIVHGGETYYKPTLINQDVLHNISQLSELAPLHNPVNVIGIKAAQEAFNQLPQVAIFDTAFHHSMPEHAFLYGLPYQLYKEKNIRRYGFHGTSHYFVGKTTANEINKPFKQCNFISAHLGNGCSVTAIKNGESVDTSLGFTPLEGVVMGTRSGDVDPGIIFYLVEHLHYSIDEVNDLLNKQSGLLGISELSNDCRTLEQAINNDNHQQAKLALDIFCYRIAKTIASYSCCFTQLDGLIFTGGIGENSSFVRDKILSQLSLLNFAIDDTKNNGMKGGKSGKINAKESRNCWVIPTNEEWVIAEQSYQLVEQLSN